MTFLCPVCNGLTTLTQSCPQCGQPLADNGRITDLFGPYSPYRPIEDIQMTDGLPDVENHYCVHILYCDRCDTAKAVSVAERTLEGG